MSRGYYQRLCTPLLAANEQTTAEERRRQGLRVEPLMVSAPLKGRVVSPLIVLAVPYPLSPSSRLVNCSFVLCTCDFLFLCFISSLLANLANNKSSTETSSHLGAKLRDWADRQAEASCYS